MVRQRINQGASFYSFFHFLEGQTNGSTAHITSILLPPNVQEGKVMYPSCAQINAIVPQGSPLAAQVAIDRAASTDRKHGRDCFHWTTAVGLCHLPYKQCWCPWDLLFAQGPASQSW